MRSSIVVRRMRSPSGLDEQLPVVGVDLADERVGPVSPELLAVVAQDEGDALHAARPPRDEGGRGSSADAVVDVHHDEAGTAALQHAEQRRLAACRRGRTRWT